MVINSEDESESEGIVDHYVPHLQELIPRPQTTPSALSAAEDARMSSPMIGQQESTIPAENMYMQSEHGEVELIGTETNEREPEESSNGRRTSGRVRKRTEVDGRCECDTEITAEEMEEGTRVMRCKARGCETGWVRGIQLLFLSHSKSECRGHTVSHRMHGLPILNRAS
jgi:hypothetical protein